MAQTTAMQGEQLRAKMLHAITEYIKQHGYAPSYREIAVAVGRKSNSTIHLQVKKMLDDGLIETDIDPDVIGAPRAFRVPGYKFVKAEDAERLTPKEVTPYATGGDPSDQQIIDCPTCGHTYWAEDWGTINFCPNCGQALNVKEVKV